MCHLILHIPKTGGTRLGELLASQPGIHFHQVKAEPVAEQTRILSEFYETHKDSDRPVILMGHFLAGIHERLGCEPRYYTLFREPVERDASGYEYIRGTPEHPEHEIARRCGLVEFITAHWLPDVQLRHLAGDCDFYAGPAPAAVSRGRQRLRNWFRSVGRHEDYRGFVGRLFEQIGIPPVDVEPVSMTRGEEAKRGLLPDELAALRGRNTLDSLLWAGAL